MNELLEKLKRRVSLVDDMLLIDLIVESVEQVKDFTRQTDSYCMDNLQGIVLQLTVIKCNRLGNEGVKNTSISGATESYEEDIPQALKKQLYRHRKMML